MDTISGIGVLDKTVCLISAVQESPASLGELVERTGISRATAHRLASGLETHGLFRKDREGRFALGLRFVALGRAATLEFPLADAARPALAALRDETDESTQLFVRDGDDRLAVVAMDSTHELRTIVAQGTRLPLSVGSAGHVLLGKTGPEGYIASVGERAPGVASVSAPVIDRDGGVIAAVSVSGPIDRMTADPGAAFGKAVLRCAEAVAKAVP